MERLAEYDEHQHRYCVPTYKRRKHNVAKRLFDYERTGLTPSEVADNEEMFKAYRHVCGGMPPEEISELVQAKQEGRLLPELPQDMDNLLEPLKLQSALNSEMRKLEFRKANRPKDVSILDYTIIAALSAVLKQAAETEKERMSKDGQN